MACLCSMMSYTLAAKNSMAGSSLTAGGWHHVKAHLLTCLVPGPRDLKTRTPDQSTCTILHFAF